MKPKTPLLAAAVAMISAVCIGASPNHISKAHLPAVEKWLLLRSDLRLANDSDCQCDRDLASMRSEASNGNYHPYYASADFNDDGASDFAVVAVPRADPSRRILIVFNGPITANSTPAYIGSADGILVLSRPWSPPQRLLVGRPYSDAAVLTPMGKSYSLTWVEP